MGLERARGLGPELFAAMLVAFLGAHAAGCAGWEPEPRARALAQEIMHCDALTLSDGGESVWQVSGCGQEIWVACTNGRNEPYCTQVRRPGSAGGEQRAEAEADAGPAAAAVSTPVPRSVDASVREFLDAHVEDVLACTGGSRVALRARWDAHGTVVLFLNGALARSAEEGCVRAAVGEHTVEEPGEGGELLHLVRRGTDAEAAPEPDSPPSEASEPTDATGGDSAADDPATH